MNWLIIWAVMCVYNESVLGTTLVDILIFFLPHKIHYLVPLLKRKWRAQSLKRIDRQKRGVLA